MTLVNVKLILAREIRDQLRDRRTLFMIAVLPIFLYPLLGLSLFQISQFVREQTTRVLVVGAGAEDLAGPSCWDGSCTAIPCSPQRSGSTTAAPTGSETASKNLAGPPPLFDENQRFAGRLFSDPSEAKLLELHFAPEGPPAGQAPPEAWAEAYAQVQSGAYEAALYFPPDFAARLDAFRKAVARQPGAEREVPLAVPSPEIIHNTASDKSQIAFARLSDVLRRWTQQIGDDNLQASGVSSRTARPFSVAVADVADAKCRQGAMWSKIMPVLLMLWALTGAFYPAIDLCAGEKERGTLETLLSSPAARGEIVLAKLLTIMLFSVVTAVLNLASVAVTGWVVLSRTPGFGLPPPMALAALVIALLPMAALFSALCLALAALARSTKEGQYYLMPLLLAIMPLVVLPMSPGVELNLGNSLIPVTGVVLMLRSVLEGDYWRAAQFSPVVAAVTLAACLVSIRWAVDQFNSESVLFRASERLEVRLWLRHLWRDRGPTPTAAAAACCGVLILVVHFFMSFSLPMPSGFGSFARTVLITQLAVIAVPALLMTLVLTGSPRQTLLLKRPPWPAIPAAALLAVVLHPTATLLQSVVQRLYPVGENILPALEKMQELFRQADFWPLLLVIALVPAVCEELAFRGFILSGFRHLGHKWRAIIYSALLFGLAHGILQQSLIASLLGVLLGYLAVQSGSIVPGVVFHVCHNALAVANSRIAPEMFLNWNWPSLQTLLMPAADGGCTFAWPVVTAGALAGFLLLAWFARLPSTKSPEESLTEAIGKCQSQLSAPATCSP